MDLPGDGEVESAVSKNDSWDFVGRTLAEWGRDLPCAIAAPPGEAVSGRPVQDQDIGSAGRDRVRARVRVDLRGTEVRTEKLTENIGAMATDVADCQGAIHGITRRGSVVVLLALGGVW